MALKLSFSKCNSAACRFGRETCLINILWNFVLGFLGMITNSYRYGAY